MNQAADYIKETDRKIAEQAARLAEFESVASALIAKLESMTTDDFIIGGERAEREKLRALLKGSQS